MEIRGATGLPQSADSSFLGFRIGRLPLRGDLGGRHFASTAATSKFRLSSNTNLITLRRRRTH